MTKWPVKTQTTIGSLASAIESESMVSPKAIALVDGNGKALVYLVEVTPLTTSLVTELDRCEGFGAELESLHSVALRIATLERERDVLRQQLSDLMAIEAAGRTAGAAAEVAQCIPGLAEGLATSRMTNKAKSKLLLQKEIESYPCGLGQSSSR